MSRTPSSPIPDDLLARAETAFRETPVPPGPSAELVRKTVAALDAASSSANPLTQRTRLRPLARAAAIVLVLTGLAYVAANLRWSSSLAFAEVADHLRDAHTLAYQISVDATKDREATTIQVYFKEPGWVRMETTSGVIIAGSDDSKQQVLTLVPKTHSAYLLEQKRGHHREAADASNPMRLVEKLRKLAATDAQPAGRQRIGKIEARGFHVQEGIQDWLVWADPETKLPVEIEVTMPSEVHATINEFRCQAW